MRDGFKWKGLLSGTLHLLCSPGVGRRGRVSRLELGCLGLHPRLTLSSYVIWRIFLGCDMGLINLWIE